MADDKSKTGKADRQRISISQDYEVRDAAELYGVTTQQIVDGDGDVGHATSCEIRYPGCHG